MHLKGNGIERLSVTAVGFHWRLSILQYLLQYPQNFLQLASAQGLYWVHTLGSNWEHF